jgi:poly(glycerol-phosphate) alpha-glucosyltransferase
MNKIKVRRDTYDTNGILSRTQYLDPINRQVQLESYYRADGSVCIYKHFMFNNNKNNLSGIHVINQMGEITKTFTTEYDLIAYAVEQILDENVHNIILIDKARFYYETLLRINKPSVSKVCMVHSSHLKNFEADIIKGKLNSNYNRIFEDLTIPDAVVLLTNRQKQHIEERFGHHDNLFVIPHSIEKEIPKVDFEKRIPLSAIYLARYSQEKQHDSLIRVFYKVIQKYPKAKLDLYGFGEDKEKIIKQVKDLGLENNIFVNDFVDNTDRIYNSAILGILPSRVEGFSLFLLECIAHGCLVVSYDIDYGPADMIDQDINGILVETNNEEEMAQKIIDLFNDEDKMKEMSQASYKKSELFHPESIAEKWSVLIEKVLKKKGI